MASPPSLKSEIQPPNTSRPHTKSRKNQSCTAIKQKKTLQQANLLFQPQPTQQPSSHLKYKHESYTSTTISIIALPLEDKYKPSSIPKPQHVKMNGEPKLSKDPTNANRIQHHTPPPPNGWKNLNYSHKQHSFGPQHIPIQQIHTKLLQG